MKRMLFVVGGLVIALAVACSAEPTIVTKAPTPTTVPPVATATPQPVPEWALEDITVNGDTVIVSIFRHSTATLTVTLDGGLHSRRDDNLPVLGFIFDSVSPGDHTIEMRDAMGNVETTSVSVEELVIDNGGQPKWLTEWVANLQAREVDNPPISITKYENQGEVVYYVVNQCCDQYSDLLDANGDLIGHPDGGITGLGDGVTVFDPTDLKGEEVWLGR